MRKLPLKNLPTTLPLAISYYGPGFCSDSLLLGILVAIAELKKAWNWQEEK